MKTIPDNDGVKPDDSDIGDGGSTGMRYLRFFGLAFAVVALSGCAYLQTLGDVDQGSRKAAKVALTAYADFVQPAILTYGQLPDCSPATPAVKLCKSHTGWQRIKDYEARASLSVAAAGAVIESHGSDDGKITQAISDIDAVVAAFKAAKEAK